MTSTSYRPCGAFGQVEDGDDLGLVDHLVADRLVLGEARPHQLDDRLRVELRPENGRGDVAAVAALVGDDVGDLERQHVGQNGDRRLGGRLGLAEDQHVIDARPWSRG